MNKKGQYRRVPPQYYQQYGPPPQRELGVHPILILGVVIFVVPFFGPVLHIEFPKFVSWIGMVTIVIGGILSIIRQI